MNSVKSDKPTHIDGLDTRPLVQGTLALGDHCHTPAHHYCERLYLLPGGQPPLITSFVEEEEYNAIIEDLRPSLSTGSEQESGDTKSRPAMSNIDHRCFHCGELIPPGVELTVTRNGENQPVCCAGCQAVAGLIECVRPGPVLPIQAVVGAESRTG